MQPPCQTIIAQHVCTGCALTGIVKLDRPTGPPILITSRTSRNPTTRGRGDLPACFKPGNRSRRAQQHPDTAAGLCRQTTAPGPALPSRYIGENRPYSPTTARIPLVCRTSSKAPIRRLGCWSCTKIKREGDIPRAGRADARICPA